MKIALVYDLIYPISFGGGEKRILAIGNLLSKSGNDVNILAPADPTVDEIYSNHLSHIKCITTPGRRYFYKKRDVISVLRFTKELTKHLMLNDYDIVDFCNFPYIPAIFGIIVLRIRRRKYCVTWLEYTGDYWLKKFPILGYFGMLIEQILLFISKNNLAISDFTMRRMGFHEPEKIIPYVILEKESRHGSEKKYFISVGRLEQHKGFDVLLAAYKIFKTKNGNTIKLVIVGSGEEKKRLMKLIQDLDLLDDVQIRSEIEDSQLEILYRSSHANIVCSEREGLGLTVLEAMSYGVPSIVCRSAFSASSELIDDNVTGILVERDAGEISNAMQEVLSGKEWDKNCLEEVKKYHPEIIYKRLMKAYHCFIGTK